MILLVYAMEEMFVKTALILQEGCFSVNMKKIRNKYFFIVLLSVDYYFIFFNWLP